MSGQPSTWPPPGLPWTEALERQLGQQLAQQRMPHAICLEGPIGIGKSVVAERFIGMLLCTSEMGIRPCGECTECTLLRAGSHPDRIQVVPDTKTGRTISVDAIRKLIERLSMRPQRQGAQVALVVPADALNAAAANALLKTLEEPAPDSHLLLQCNDPATLPVTVLSRCLRLRVAAPEKDQALAWLNAQDGAAATALALELADGRPLLAQSASVGDRLANWDGVLQRLEQLRGGKSGVAVTAQALAKTPDEAIEVLQRLLEAALDGALGGNKFTHLREQAHLTSQVQESTLQAAWLACKRARQQLGSGLRDDMALARLIKQVGVTLNWQLDRQQMHGTNTGGRGYHR